MPYCIAMSILSQASSISLRCFFRGAARSAVPLEEECLDGSPQLVKFLLRRQVLGEVGNQFRSEPVWRDGDDPVGILDYTLVYADGLAGFDVPGGFCIRAAYFHLASLAGFGGLGPGLEDAEGPEDFVYSV